MAQFIGTLNMKAEELGLGRYFAKRGTSGKIWLVVSSKYINKFPFLLYMSCWPVFYSVTLVFFFGNTP